MGTVSDGKRRAASAYHVSLVLLVLAGVFSALMKETGVSSCRIDGKYLSRRYYLTMQDFLLCWNTDFRLLGIPCFSSAIFQA